MSPSFTPASALVGGALIGLGATLLFAVLGRIAGISGLFNSALEQVDERGWRLAFLLGRGAAATAWLMATDAPVRTGFPLAWLVGAGLLVGFGTRVGNGCTSGHGICGLSRLSRRSLVATLVFMATAFATTYVVRHVLGGLA